jgi:glyoxylase-like metal-dependent hydrolase (beta-lactamase superfamily II)
MRYFVVGLVANLLAVASTLSAQPNEIVLGAPYAPEGSFADICAQQISGENSNLPLSPASDDWFRIYEAGPGVYSIVEPYQFQETISHLIVGETRALLFDTGMGFLPLRAVVERLTNLPVTVLNSHTHFDHTGANAEFDSILAIDSDYTRANMAGFDNSAVAGDIAPDAFCEGPPVGMDVAKFTVKAWQATGYVKDGDVIDLGGRSLQVLHVPGHTPDATALLDADNGLLFTGDTYYDAELWLFVPETNLDDYERSLARLAELEKGANYLLGAHRSARVRVGHLAKVKQAVSKLRSGNYRGEPGSDEPIVFVIDGIELVTAQTVLDGSLYDDAKGGSGLTEY